MISSNEAFSKIAESLLVDYTSVYYVDAVTNEYWWYSIDPNFHSLQLEQRGTLKWWFTRRTSTSSLWISRGRIF